MAVDFGKDITTYLEWNANDRDTIVATFDNLMKCNKNDGCLYSSWTKVSYNGKVILDNPQPFSKEPKPMPTIIK